MNLSLALSITTSFAICAGLLWLGAGVGIAAAQRPAPIGRALLVVSVLMSACALWWPANAIHVQASMASSVGARSLLPWASALVLAALACAVSSFWRGSGQAARQGVRVPLAIAAALALPVAAYVYAVLCAPGVFQLAQAPGWLGAGSLVIGLALSLVVLQLPLPALRHAGALRAGAVLIAAAVVCGAALLSMREADAVRSLHEPEGLVMIAMLAIGGVLFALLQADVEAQPGLPARPMRHTAVDTLTGLPTRLFFEARLRVAAKECEASSSRMAVLFIDLDGFKPVNDTFGHSSGDQVLEQVGKRLKAFARNSSVAARIGGDEFLLLAPGSGSPNDGALLAARLIDALSQPYRIDGREVTISCSVGISLYPGGCHPNKLIARADAAMYAAKRAGGARHCFYAPTMDADVQQNFDMLRDLRTALAHDQLELYFQPKIDARTGKVTAAEALLRWNHPTRGMVMPNDFIPLAERSGLIGPLGNWVVEAACKQARAWRDKGLRMRVAINLSAHQMRQDDIADRIASALTRHRIHPSLLTCEITETAAMEDTGATQETFRRLGELGAHLSIDDFGTGYSSLSYLRKLPAEELKIDASFVKDVDHSADARAVVDAVVKLAHALGLKVVAEGVESVRQRRVLVELGCDELQGFLFAKPMTARALLLWAMNDRSASAVFSNSLFGETRQASRLGGLEDLQQQRG